MNSAGRYILFVCKLTTLLFTLAGMLDPAFARNIYVITIASNDKPQVISILESCTIDQIDSTQARVPSK